MSDARSTTASTDAPRRLAKLAERVWQYRLSRDPYFQSRHAIPVTRILPDSLSCAEEDSSFAASALPELRQIGAAIEKHDDFLTLEFLRDELNRLAAAPSLWWAQFPVTPYAASVLMFHLQLIFQPFEFHAREDGDRYLALVVDYARLVDSMRTKILQQAQCGWCVPAPALGGVITTLRGLKSAAAHILPIAPERLKAVVGGGDLIDAVARALRTEVEPAFDALIAALGSDYARAAPQAVGLAQFRGGEEAYRALVRQHATFDIDPERIHAVGLVQVAQLSEQMREVRSRLGFNGSEDAFIEHLRSTGRLHARSAQDVEERYRHHIERMKKVVHNYFRVLPKAPYSLAPLPQSMQAGMSYGYYQPPTSANPVGVYRYNGGGLETRSQLSSAALIFHELVPGHHFHLARQAENHALPMIRREAVGITAFNEGWAEYAAGLAQEMGLYDDPYDWYGRLTHERFTAQRLVVDTGMNLFDWSLERARAYMKANTLESDTQVASETLRYSTDIPAQALSYRLGFLKFRQLRERAQAALGPGFDVRDYHEAVLSPGALPLALLERHIDQFVATRGTNNDVRIAL